MLSLIYLKPHNSIISTIIFNMLQDMQNYLQRIIIKPSDYHTNFHDIIIKYLLSAEILPTFYEHLPFTSNLRAFTIYQHFTNIYHLRAIYEHFTRVLRSFYEHFTSIYLLKIIRLWLHIASIGENLSRIAAENRRKSATVGKICRKTTSDICRFRYT